MTDTRIGNWITTFSGKKFYPLDPKIEDIDINDIAHALSNICRYTGHVRKFYSVAQHSVYVSNTVPKKDALSGLLHDASEAYINDVARPLKHSIVMKPYRDLEKVIESVIAQKYNLPIDHPDTVNISDQRMLLTEIRDLMPVQDLSMVNDLKPFRFVIKPVSPEIAEQIFLDRFYELSETHE